jgi:acetyl esterase/lipase
MLEHGYAIVAINYRLSQHAIFPPKSKIAKRQYGGYRAHATQYNLDSTRIIAWGESAGGHLASMLGTSGQVARWDVGAHLEYPSTVAAVVDFYGATDFLQTDSQRLSTGMTHDDADSPESELVGGAIQAHPEATAQANPITHITSDAPPFLVIHGDADPLVPYGQSVIFVEALRQANVPVTFYTVTGGGHGGFSDPAIVPLVDVFLHA